MAANVARASAECPSGPTKALRWAMAGLFPLVLGACGYVAISIEAGAGLDRAWISIHLSGQWGTTGNLREPSIALEGIGSAPPGLPCGTPGYPIPGYRITWTNASTGQAGLAETYLDCLTPDVMRWYTPPIPLALGENTIQVRVRDPNGATAVDAITLRRLP